MKKETKNSVMTGLVLSAFTGALNPVIKAAATAVSSHMIHTVDISSAEFNLAEGIRQYFKDIPDKLFIEIGSDVNNLELTYRKNIGAWERSCTNCSSTIIWDHTPITFKCIVNDNKNNDPSNMMTLSTINTPEAKKTLRRFIKMLATIQHRHDIKNERTSTVLFCETNRGTGLSQRYLPNLKRRTFENTFIPSDQERMIKEAIDTFKANRNWYLENNIPYHFGFLLYGQGGTGKSSIAQAIAEYADAQLISFPGDKISEFPKMMGNMISSASIDSTVYRIILIEDIDCGFAERAIDNIYDDETGQFKNVERKVGLASILNTLDGLSAPTNAIYVFTTNHIEKLDPALIRPGRCDVKLEIPCVNPETFAKFVKYHYGENISTDDLDILKPITFAELQTLVMGGSSVADLLEYIKNKKEN